MPIKEKIANTFVSAILNSNGGPAGTRTPVCNSIQIAFYTFSLFQIFISPKRTNKPKTNYTLLYSFTPVRVAQGKYILLK